MTKKLLSLLMVLVLVVGMLPVSAFAAESAGTTATVATTGSTDGKTAQVYLTVSNKGVLAKAADDTVMAERAVTVRDLDGDDVLTYHEALIAAHEAYCPDGYGTSETTYGISVTKLWGVSTWSTLFLCNNVALSAGVGDSTSTVKDGDHLVAAVMKDGTDYSDYYAYFDKTALEVKANEDFTLNLKGFLGMGYQPTPEALKDIKIGTWSDGTFTQIDSKATDESGNVTLSFASSGTYYVTAEGEVANVTVTDYNGTPTESGYPTKQVNAPIIAPVCVVEVVESGECGKDTASDITWKLNKSTGVLTISGTGATSNWNYSTRAPWNSFSADIKTIVVEEGVTMIGKYAFNGYSSVKTMYLPKSLTGFGTSALYNVKAEIMYYGTQDQWAAVTGTSSLNGLAITCNYGRTDIALIKENSESFWFATGEDGTNALKITITKPEALNNISVKWYVNDTDSTSAGTEIESSRVSVSDDGLTLFCTPDLTTVGEKYYYCKITSVLTEESVTVISETAKINCVERSEKFWDGRGAQSDPFKLSSAEDLTALSNFVAAGNTAEGLYFAITADITLPDDWVPIGGPKTGQTWTPLLMARNYNLFKGHIDGAKNDGSDECWTITVPKGGKTMMGAVSGATISNLNIYGEKINGYGVVEYYAQDKSVSPIVVIDNVTLKSGTHTMKSGFIGGYASGVDTVIIRNSTVEEGVVIGDDGTYPEWAEELEKTYQYNWGPNSGKNHANYIVQYNDMVGSFAGSISGTIENCVSYAKVYGRDFVGGILGFKGQSMGDCIVKNCVFSGEVHASGEYAGGIIGAGYLSSTAPNTPATTIQNCKVTGLVEGADYVGGILGGEQIAQCWDNGIGYIQNNRFVGTLRSSGNYVGGIIGYMRSLNRYTIIENNLYAGADKGIGGVQYVDTSNTSHETASGALYFSTESDTTGCPTVTGCSWKTAHNRTDDPLGADAANLTSQITLTKIEVSGSCKTEYAFGEALDLSGLTLTACWSDNTTSQITHGTLQISGYSNVTVGEQNVALGFCGKSVHIQATVMPVKNIVSIEKTGSDGQMDTYTITYADGSTSTFTIVNGTTGDKGEDGADGANGADGADGANGVDGKDGADGVNGKDGIDAIPNAADESTDGKLAIVATIVAGVSLVCNMALVILFLMKKSEID